MSGQGGMPVSESSVSSDPHLVAVARALWAQGSARSVILRLQKAGLRVLILKGPELQWRLYGTPAEYASSDVDVLVHRSDGARARQLLVGWGWRFEPTNSVLWRVSRAATYERGGFRLDLHWGL